MPARMTEELFWSKVDIRSENECWPWLGCKDKDGYGQLRWADKYERQNVKAHRVAWELKKGPIPEGLGVLHNCDSPDCINYEKHMFLGTQADNQRDMSAKGRNHNTAKKFCVNGHAFTEENTYRSIENGKPRRHCRRCMLLAQRRHNGEEGFLDERV